MMNRLFLFILITLGLAVLPAGSVHAQKRVSASRAQEVSGTQRYRPEGTTKVSIDEEAAAIAYRPDQITLYVGEKNSAIFAEIPNGVVFKGGYKKIGSVSFDRQKNQFEFHATAVGQESLTVLDSVGHRLFDVRIHVRPVNLANIASQIRQSLQGLDGVVINPHRGKIIVKGVVCSIHDFERVGDAVTKHGGDFAVNEVTFLRSAWAKLEDRLQASIDKTLKNSKIKVRSERDQIILEGTTTAPVEKKKAESLAYAVNLEKPKGSCVPALGRHSLLNEIKVVGALAEKKPQESIIEIVVQLVELQPDYEQRLGVQKPDFTPTDRQPARAIAFGTDAPKKGVVTNLGSKLNWAQRTGYARVLKTAKFIGGEREGWHLKESVRLRRKLDIPGVSSKPNLEPSASSATDQDVEFRFIFYPSVDSLDPNSVRIALNVTTESRSVSASTSSTLPSASLQEVVTVKSGESALVANFIPLLSWMGGELTPVGDTSGPFATLFSSRDYKDRKSRFVLLVTPIIRTSSL